MFIAAIDVQPMLDVNDVAQLVVVAFTKITDVKPFCELLYYSFTLTRQQQLSHAFFSHDPRTTNALYV